MPNVTTHMLAQIAGCELWVAEKVLPRALRTMRDFDIRTRKQVAAFLANCAQETDHFNTYEEYGDEEYFRSFLGDEWHYHGRGAIMLTWSHNYKRAGEFVGMDFVNNPHMVAVPDVAWSTAGWYWRHGSAHGDINPIAESGDFDGVVVAINGGYNGYQERLNNYNKALEVLPEEIELGEEAMADYPTLWVGVDKNGWVVDGSGHFVRARNIVNNPFRTNGNGWMYAENHTKPPVEDGVLKVGPNTRFRKAVDYLKPAINRAPYWIWREGIIPDGPGAYATNRMLPHINDVIRGGVFCAGVGNLALRAVGKRVPTRGNELYDGGVAAYWTSPWGDGYFTGYDESFDLQKAKRWARETRSGVLLGREYTGGASAELNEQGHVAILLPSGYVLQSWLAYPNGKTGLNWDYTIEQSHDGGYYTRMVHPANWIEYTGDEF